MFHPIERRVECAGSRLPLGASRYLRSDAYAISSFSEAKNREQDNLLKLS